MRYLNAIYNHSLQLEIVAVDHEDYNTSTKIVKFVVLPRRGKYSCMSPV